MSAIIIKRWLIRYLPIHWLLSARHRKTPRKYTDSLLWRINWHVNKSYIGLTKWSRTQLSQLWRSGDINRKIFELTLSWSTLHAVKICISSICAISHTHMMLSLISYTLLNYSHLWRQAEFMNGKALSRYTSMLTERYRPRTKVRGRESSRWRWHHRYHGHGLCRFWIRDTCRISELSNDL